jgi:hypothetical protein
MDVCSAELGCLIVSGDCIEYMRDAQDNVTQRHYLLTTVAEMPFSRGPRPSPRLVQDIITIPALTIAVQELVTSTSRAFDFESFERVFTCNAVTRRLVFTMDPTP